jgi:hypothetical protein
VREEKRRIVREQRKRISKRMKREQCKRIRVGTVQENSVDNSARELNQENNVREEKRRV